MYITTYRNWCLNGNYSRFFGKDLLQLKMNSKMLSIGNPAILPSYRHGWCPLSCVNASVPYCKAVACRSPVNICMSWLSRCKSRYPYGKHLNAVPSAATSKQQRNWQSTWTPRMGQFAQFACRSFQLHSPFPMSIDINCIAVIGKQVSHCSTCFKNSSVYWLILVEQSAIHKKLQLITSGSQIPLYSAYGNRCYRRKGYALLTIIQSSGLH